MIYYDRMELFKKPTAEEAEELRWWAEWVIELGYEWFENLKKEMPWCTSNLMRFFMLPHSELHDRFRDAICKPDHAKFLEDETWVIRGQIRAGVKKFISDHHLDAYESSKVKYHIANRRTLINHLDGSKDEVLLIGIPYEMDWKVRFAGSVLVYKSKAPAVFAGCLDKYPWFSGDTEFSFLSGK
jgi:hypothetical protein